MKISNIDTQDLLDNHIIDEEVANNIENYYLEKERNKKKFLTNTSLPLCIVAAIFIITGVCFLLADNWESIPHGLQVIVGILPIIIGSAACYYVFLHKYESRAFKEAASVIYCVGLVTTYCMINEIFDIKIAGVISIFLLAILAYPIVFLFRSVIASSVIIASLCISTPEMITMYDYVTVALYLIIICIDAIFLYKTYYKERDTFLVKFRTATLPLVLLFIISWGHIILTCEKTNDTDELLIFASIFASASISYALHSWIRQSSRIQSNASFLKASAYIANFITLAIFAFNRTEYDTEDGLTMFPTMALIQILLLGFSFFMKWKRGLKIELDEWITLPLIPLVLIIPHAYLTYTFQVLIIIYLAYLTFFSIRTIDVLKLNLALVGWYAFMLMTIDQYNQSTILIGTLSIVWGVVLILINLFISKRKSHGLQQNN